MKKLIKGFTLVEVVIIVTIIVFLCSIAIPNLLKNKDNQKAKEMYNSLYSVEKNIKSINEDINNRFIIIPHDDHWGGKRIRVDTVQDTSTGKSYIIFRGYDGITALEIK